MPEESTRISYVRRGARLRPAPGQAGMLTPVIRTRRWNDPAEPDDGFRLLVCRIRPRGVSKQKETWDDWWPDLGPSRGLLDDFHGKHGPPITWESYAARYLVEMGGAQQLWRIRDLARRAA